MRKECVPVDLEQARLHLSTGHQEIASGVRVCLAGWKPRRGMADSTIRTSRRAMPERGDRGRRQVAGSGRCRSRSEVWEGDWVP